MTELILVRHGQPAWSVGGRARNDPELTELGHAQAAAIAGRLADHDAEPARGPVDRLYVSPAVRAAQTAAPIEAALNMKAETRDWLLELQNPPDWEDGPIEAVESAFARFNAGSREQWWEGLPGGESFRDFHRRVTGGVESLLGELDVVRSDQDGLWNLGAGAPERIVAVAHGGTNSMAIAHLLGVEPQPWEWERFVMGHASVAVLETAPVAGAHIWALRLLGDAHHIDVDQRTR